MNRKSWAVMGSTFAFTLTFVGTQVAFRSAWRYDGWLLLLLAIVHVVLVTVLVREVDRFLTITHSALLLVELTMASMVMSVVVGRYLDGGQHLVPQLLELWSLSDYLAPALVQILVRVAVFVLAVGTVVGVHRRRLPRLPDLIPGVYVASVVNVGVDFALYDVVLQSSAYDPWSSGVFFSRAAVSSLDRPLVVHLLVLFGSWLVVANQRRKRDAGHVPANVGSI